MTYINKTVVELLSELFGLPRRYSHALANVPYNCPKCDRGASKYNLEVNTSKGVFHCWACGYKGKILKLFHDYATERQWSVLRSLSIYKESSNSLEIAKTAGPRDPNLDRVSLGSHRSLVVEWKDSIHYVAAKRYLSSRGLDTRVIKKWDMAYAETGPNKHRIIIPSRSREGVLEYYIARSYYPGVVPKYKNPTVAKQSIIFGESFVDWRRPVVLVEGVFDAIVALNAVPILGTEIKSHKKLLGKIRANNTPVVICLDAEAWEKAKEAYKILDDLGVDTKIIRMERYNDLSTAYEQGGKEAVLSILDSAHYMTFEESLW